ncbi:MAG TPA: beta-ketoacyl synthase N-terminal-like domain-containing protein, partial [Propionibacteriaceae bacterium]|nr:beta-ketoacyl synthase N-terminal-like domain-containing protein [Propionibacteriaceae bacterium]
MPTIVITGLGATTPLGGDLPSTWDALVSGRSGVRRIEEAWADDLQTKIAAQAAVDPATTMDRVEARRLDRSTQFALVAAMEAWRDAGFGLGEESPVDRDRLLVSIASGIGGLQSLIQNWDAQKDKGPRRVSPFTIPLLIANAPAANVGLKVGARAGVHAPVSACASSNEAIALASDLMRLGRADVALV